MSILQTNLENFSKIHGIKPEQNLLVEVDFEQLEICVAAFLSGDKTLTKEIQDGTDIHADNQSRFRLPTRLVAKTFVFRLLYGGSAYSYSIDPDFTSVSTKKLFWQSTIDAFYEKYPGIKSWHSRLIMEVEDNGGYYTSPFGREFTFTKTKYGDYPPTDIKNYIVQGTGSDIITSSRVLLANISREQNIFKSTVHDSNLYMVPYANALQLALEIKHSYAALPGFINSYFPGRLWELPCRCKIQVGLNWGNMTTIFKG